MFYESKLNIKLAAFSYISCNFVLTRIEYPVSGSQHCALIAPNIWSTSRSDSLPEPWVQFLVSVKANIPRMVSGSSCIVLLHFTHQNVSLKYNI